MLSITNFRKTYGRDKVAVKDLTLTVSAGDIVGFIGHNGAGKTTTIKAVVGLLPFDSGEITVCGHSVLREPTLCKSLIAYIPDTPELYDTLTGISYLNFIADIYGVPSEERREKIERYAGLLELRGDLASPIGSYSHGMKQKLAVISALIHDPRLMVLDEPFVGLDPKASFTLKNLMRDFCQRGGAIFFSTHVLEVAEKLCDKIAIIKEGELIAEGSMEQVKGDHTLEQVFLELTDHE